jgi:hypothetical protein
MAINESLVQGIQDALGVAIVPSLTEASALSDLFEAYVYSIVLDAARDLGAQIEYRNLAGATTQFVFRTSPGFIFSKAQPYTYAVIALPDSALLEAHLGIRVAGKSDVLHECDVAVLHRSEAETCRQNSVDPRSAKLIMAVECKFYTVSLPLGLARSFIGLSVDMRADSCHFVVNTSSDTIEKLLAHHARHWEHQLVPGAAVEVNRLRNSFQTVFKNFTAVNR